MVKHKCERCGKWVKLAHYSTNKYPVAESHKCIGGASYAWVVAVPYYKWVTNG